MTNKSNILKRKFKGKSKLKEYKFLFKDFKEIVWYDIEESDIILNEFKKKVLENNSRKTEFIDENENFIESDLLREVYQKVDDYSESYIFTDDFEYCGIFRVASKEAFEKALFIAKSDRNNTCFILDRDFSFSFTINYYDKKHNDYPMKFDIQRSSMGQVNCNDYR